MLRQKETILTFGLWLVTAVIGFWQIELVRELLLRLVAHFSSAGFSSYDAFRQTQIAGGLGTSLIIVAAIIWIVAIIGSAEYYRTHLGQPIIWRLFMAILGAEMGIFLLTLII